MGFCYIKWESKIKIMKPQSPKIVFLIFLFSHLVTCDVYSQWKIKKDDGPFGDLDRILVVETGNNNFPYNPILLADREGFILPYKGDSLSCYRFAITSFNGIITESISNVSIEAAVMVDGDWVRLEPDEDIWGFQNTKSTDNTDWFELLVLEKVIDLMKKGQKITIRLFDKEYEQTTTFQWTLSGSTKALNYLLN
jgi:hypothetical protein